MLADQKFIFVLSREDRKMLDFLAKREKRSRANLIKVLVAERYQQVAKPQPVTDPRPIDASQAVG